MLSFFRVDDRLVHGQVVEGWIPAFGIQALAVISDEISADLLRQKLIEFAVPAGIEIKFISLADAPKELAAIDSSPLKTMVLMPSMAEPEAMVRAGIKISSLNIGGLLYSACRGLSKGQHLSVSDKEKEGMKFLSMNGVVFDGRGVPSDISLDMLELAGLK